MPGNGEGYQGELGNTRRSLAMFPDWNRGDAVDAKARVTLYLISTTPDPGGERRTRGLGRGRGGPVSISDGATWRGRPSVERTARAQPREDGDPDSGVLRWLLCRNTKNMDTIVIRVRERSKP